MRTRCPVCATVFRVTSEQLRLRAGKVRCGQCQAVFNAFDELVGEAHETSLASPQPNEAVAPEVPTPQAAETPAEAYQSEPEAQEIDSVERALLESFDVPNESSTWDAPESPEPLAGFAAEPVPAVDEAPVMEEVPEAPVVPEVESIQPPLDEPLAESTEESTSAARLAGLVAARELSDAASFNRWSAGTLVSDEPGGFDGDSSRRAVWPFVLVAALLLGGLLGQLLYHYRTSVVLSFPALAGVYEVAAVDIPLPRNSALVSIEASDLQSDNARGLFVLQATLKNRAGYAQAWPALELSLTDTSDTVVSRRVIHAAEYLPPGTASDTFPANGELAVKLWIEAKESGATGYRLYIFYP